MKSQDILQAALMDFGAVMGTYSARDANTIDLRASYEGEAFFEIALPRLDDALLQGLSTGQLPKISGWSTKRGSRLPKFLYGYWKKIFDLNGVLLATPSVDAIRYVRQLTRLHKKVFDLPKDDRVADAVDAFVRTDLRLVKEVSEWDIDALTHIAHTLFGKIVGRAVTRVHSYRHGPGAVAEGLDSVGRYDFRTVSPRAAELVGIEQFRATWHDLLESPPILDEVPARLVAVPKTAIKPRLITIEPSYNQYLQQGLAAALRTEMDRYPQVRISDQSRNRALARIGSIDGRLSTVDLSDASDRLRWDLVQKIFSWNPTFVDFLAKTRSEHVLLPTGDSLVLNKFAGMGSALTFPVQTMVYAAMAVLAMSAGYRSRKSIKAFWTNENWGVYGDDIVIPTDAFPILTELLEGMNLSVNFGKSFSTGLFRESCGGDYYAGMAVQPLYIRRRPPRSRRDVEGIVSFSSLRNQWVERYGYGNLTRLLDSHLSGLIRYEAGLPGYAGISKVGPEDIPNVRWNQHLQTLQYRSSTVHYKRKKVQATPRAMLFAALSAISYRGKTPVETVDARRLTHHGRPVSAVIRYRWVG